MFLYSYFVVFNVMGRDYDSAVMTAGFIGFGMGATSNAMANMQVVTKKYGPSPVAYFAIPMVGSLFIDFFNASIIAFTSDSGPEPASVPAQKRPRPHQRGAGVFSVRVPALSHDPRAYNSSTQVSSSSQLSASSSMACQEGNFCSSSCHVRYQKSYRIPRWAGRISSMITLSRSKSSGSPATPGKETATCPIPTSATRAGIPHPVIVSLMSARVKLSPPMRNSAARAAASCRGRPPAGGRRAGRSLQAPDLRRHQGALPLDLLQGIHGPVQGLPLGVQLPAVEGGLQVIDPQGPQQLPQILSVAHSISSTLRVPSTGRSSASTARSAAGAEMA